MMTRARIEGPKKHGYHVCAQCGKQLESKKRKAAGLCLQCAGGGSGRPLRECAGSHALRALLAKRELTIRAFAAEIGVQEGLVGAWCRGNQRPCGFYQRLLERGYEIPSNAWPRQRVNGGRHQPQPVSEQRLVEVRH